MKTTDPEKLVHEIAESTRNDEELVSRMYAEAVEQYRRDAHVMDYVPLFAAKRVREALKSRTSGFAEE
jgi:hypothetical protein